MIMDKYLSGDAHPTTMPVPGFAHSVKAFVYNCHMHNQLLPSCVGMSPVGFMDIKVQGFLTGSRNWGKIAPWRQCLGPVSTPAL